MPNDNGDAGLSYYNNSAQSMVNRAGVGMSDKDALEELAARRTSAVSPSSPASSTQQAASGDDADKAALAELQRRRSASPQETASLGPPTTFDERFSAAPPMAIGDAAKQMIAQKGLAGAIVPFYKSQLQRLTQEHPYIAGGMLAGMSIPSIAGAAYFGGIPALRYGIPFAMQNLQRIGLAGLGLEQLYQHGPSLLSLIRGK